MVRLPLLEARKQLLALGIWDALLLFASYAIVYRLRLGRWWGDTPEALGFALLWWLMSYLLGRYSREIPSRSLVARRVLRTLAAAGLVLLAIQASSWLGRVLMEATRFRGFLLPFLALVVLGSAVGQCWLRWAWKGRDVPWLLVLDQWERVVLERELAADQRRWGQAPTAWCCCTAAELEQRLGQPPHAGVAIGPRALRDPRSRQLLLEARQHGLICCGLDRWCERFLQRLPPELFEPDSLLIGDGAVLQPGQLIWQLKRLGDVVVAFLLLLATAPLLLLAMLLVKLNDGGPVFYHQRRTGQFGAVIWITKLRTMVVDAEADGIRWAAAEDPRITGVGHWLRRWRIDELPQLWSVLSGEMSLIGPRPERPELEQALERDIPQYRLRHWLKPGLSGWAQVCFPYGASVADSRAKLSYDLYYLRNAGPLLDLLILAMTFRLLAGGRGVVPVQRS